MNLSKVFAALMRPAYWPALARRVVPSVEHGPAFEGVEPRTIIDVGANKGQFSMFAAVRWPRARIFSFEPLEEPAARLKRILGERVRLFGCAIGDVAAQTVIHVASREDSSSLLPLGSLQKKLFRMEEVSTRRIDVRRLDAVLDADDVQEPALLKIDVQGFEHQVLLGLGDLVEPIEWVYVEVSFVELYQGQKLFPDIERLLGEMNFGPAQFFNKIYNGDKLIQADALFKKVYASASSSQRRRSGP